MLLSSIFQKKIGKIEKNCKNFSFDKFMKLIDSSNCVCIDIIKKTNFNDVSNYKKSKYLFDEIPLELMEVNKLLHESKTLMAVALLRNAYEEIMYIIATSSIKKIDINLETTAGHFITLVKNNSNNIFGDSISSKVYWDFYSALSQLTHTTDLKELASLILSKPDIEKYLTNEIKYYFFLINYIYVSYINIKLKTSNDLMENFFELNQYAEILNSVYFFAFAKADSRKINKMFYSSKDDKIIKEKIKKIKNNKDIFVSMNDGIDEKFNKLGSIIDQQLKDSGYNEMFMKELNS